MDIGFIWDEDKYREVQRKHNVRFYEVVSAFDDPKGYETLDPQGHEDRWMLVGATFNGRVLAVIFSEEGAPPYRLITAFEAKGEYLNGYKGRAGI